MKQKQAGITLFFSYAQADQIVRDRLVVHLSQLKRDGLIEEWSDLQVLAGSDRAREIERAIHFAQIILLLISADFLASDACYLNEMKQALERHKRGKTRVIPIIVRHCDWQHSPFAHLQCLPHNHQPLSDWNDQDEAFLAIVQELRLLIEQESFLPTPLFSVPRQNREYILKQIRNTWITGLLDQSLHQVVWLDLHLQDQPNALENPWRSDVPELNLPPRLLPIGTTIVQVYDEADGKLLLLGEPGSGKTTLLLHLVRTLLDRAEADERLPVPIIFNLSSWAANRPPLEEWFIEQLYSKYYVPRAIAQAWISQEQIIPLLDGLDEVAVEYRARCVSAISAYFRTHHLIPLVVCCRKAEYDALPTRVKLQTAIMIQPLTLHQIDTYCKQIGEPIAALRQALQQETDFQELATTPLMLNIMTLAYQGASVSDISQALSSEQLQQRTFAQYVERALARRRPSRLYPKEQTLHWLSWLARQMKNQAVTEFYPEHLHSNWLPTPQIRFIYNATTALLAGLLVGPLFGVLTGALAGLFAKSLVGLFAGLIAGLFFGVSEYRPVEIIHWKWVRVRQNVLLLLVVGLLTGLLAGLIVGALAGLLAGLLEGLLVLVLVVLLAGLREYQPLEIIRWKWVQVRQNVLSLLLIGLLIGPLVGLLAGLLIAPFVGLLAGLFAELFLGLSVGFSSHQLDPRELIISNDSAQYARRNGFHFGLLTGLLAGLLVGLFTGLLFGVLTGIFAGVLFGLLVGLLFGLLFGLGAFLHQQKLLAFLRCIGAIPRRYIQFLDYAAECILLRKIGGGYIFIHRLLLEYFAALDEPKPSTYTAFENKTEKHTPDV